MLDWTKVVMPEIGKLNRMFRWKIWLVPWVGGRNWHFGIVKREAKTLQEQKEDRDREREQESAG